MYVHSLGNNPTIQTSAGITVDQIRASLFTLSDTELDTVSSYVFSTMMDRDFNADGTAR
jgi:hypothetical protein